MAFVFDPGAPAADEVKRVLTEQLEAALRELADPRRKGMETRVHSARKHCKRVRAVVRLVRPALGRDYRRSNVAVRDASALLSPLRDAHAVLATFDTLTGARSDLFAPEKFDDVRAWLAERAATMSDPGSARDRFSDASALLSQTAERVSEWRLKLDLGVVIDGAAEYHGMGRRAFKHALADSSDEAMHEWRKRVKDGWYHTQLLGPLAPSILVGIEAALDSLSGALGDNNDLAVLSEALRSAGGALGEHQVGEALGSIEHVRAELFARCQPLGARVYADNRDEYRSRLRGYAKAYRAFGPEQPVGEISKIFAPQSAGT